MHLVESLVETPIAVARSSEWREERFLRTAALLPGKGGQGQPQCHTAKEKMERRPQHNL